MDDFNLKELFIPSEGLEYIVEIDLSQLEIMALAELTDDDNLRDLLNSGGDLHRSNAAFWLKKPPDEVSDKERRAAKTITFMLQYGAGLAKMAEATGISEQEVKDFKAAFLRRFPKVAEMYTTLDEWRKSYTGECAPINGVLEIPIHTPTHRRYFAGVYQSDRDGMWSPSATQSKNYPTQGFATGDLIPLVGMLIESSLDDSANAHLINTVHDSFVYECDGDGLRALMEATEDAFNKLPVAFKSFFGYRLTMNYTYGFSIGETWDTPMELSREEIKDLLRE